METTDVFTALFTRRSVRKFSAVPIAAKEIRILLKAAMAAPSSENNHHRRYIVISDKEKLDLLADIHPSASPARQAAVAILVCADTAEKPQTLFWPQDCAASIENILLAGRALGIASLWCGIHPKEELEERFIQAFQLPDMVRPAGVVILGYPEQDFFEEKKDDPSHVFLNKWGDVFPVGIPQA